MVLVSSVCSAAPDPASHSLTVLSHDTDASTLPSGEKVTALTGPEWLSNVCSAAPDPVSLSLTVLSCDADASTLPVWREGNGVDGVGMALERLQQRIPVLFDLWQRLTHAYALGTVP